MKKILKSLFVLTVVAGLAAGATKAFFTDTETSTGNVLQAGAIDLTVDNESYYNGALSDLTTWVTPANLNDGQGPSGNGSYLFFNFDDLKPGDWGEDTISLHVDTNPAYACMDFTLTSNDDASSVEPELDVEGEVEDNPENIWDGELAQNLYFIWWADDGDNVLEDNEYDNNVFYEGSLLGMGFDQNYHVTIPLVDSITDRWGDTFLSPDKTYYIGKAWCFGGYSVNPVPQDFSGDLIDPTGPQGPGITCNPAGDHNIAQTDLVTANIEFTAVQHRNNPDFRCVSCENLGYGYATHVVSNIQGPLKNGSPVTDPARTDPNDALGAPDGQFYSLGFAGELVVNFADKVYDVAGEELSLLSFHEVTNGRDTYPEENANVYVSQNGSDWQFVGTISNQDNGTGVSLVDIGPSGYDWIQYVKLVDATNPAIHSATADGYDVDAIDADHICLDNQVDSN